MLLFFTVAFSNLILCGQTSVDGEKLVPSENYELKYLGCSQQTEPKTESHIGNFLLIWKSNSKAEIMGIPSSDGKNFNPTADFEFHGDKKWIYVGRTGIEAPGTQWFAIEPGQVLALKINMFLTEHDDPIFPSVRGADKARLLLQTKLGRLESEDISLPLIPAASK